MVSSDGSYVSMVHSFQPSMLGAEPIPQLGVVVKRSYRLRHGQLLEPMDVSGDLRAGVIQQEPMYLDAAREPMLVQESDLTCFYKHYTDVLLDGRCHALGHGIGGRALLTGLAIGPVHKQVRVWGDRVVRAGRAGSLRFEQSQAFETMPVSWTHAYGGIDEYASGKLALAKVAAAMFPFARHDDPLLGALGYVRNRFGRGYYLDLDIERIDGTLAPNLDDPADPVTAERMLTKGMDDWMRLPSAAAFGAVDAVTFPRCVSLGIAPPNLADSEIKQLYEVRNGQLTASALADAEPNEQRYNCAAPGLSGAQLSGGEGFRLVHLHREHQQLDGWLPRSSPQLYVEPPNTRQFELKARLGMVVFEPDRDRVTLTWTGKMPVAAVFPEEMCAEMPHAVSWS